MEYDGCDAMDYECESSAKVSRRGSSAVIELDISYAERRASASRPMHRASEPGTPKKSKKDELSDLGETLEHLTAEYGLPLTVAVDEDGCPYKPNDLRVYRHPYLKTLCRSRREAIQPLAYRYVVVNFRVMRRNADMYVGYLLSQKGVKRRDLYKTKYLPIWTHCVRIKMRVNVKVGIIFHGLKSRLGLTSALGLHFCVDGFYGYEAYGDAFGNVGAGICPWMELIGNGSAKSLRLKDGDNIYVSVATDNMRQMVLQRRTQRRPSAASGVTFEASSSASSNIRSVRSMSHGTPPHKKPLAA